MIVRDSNNDPHDVPDYLWIPPDTVAGFNALNQVDVGRNPPAPTGQAASTANLPQNPEANPGDDAAPKNGQTCKFIPHPQSDFEHIDPDDPIVKAVPATAAALASTPSYLRFRTLYDWLLRRLVDICMNLSQAAADPNASSARQKYANARDAFINFVEDLDDHEPEKKRGIKSGEKGYGRAIKWFQLQPEIGLNSSCSTRTIEIKSVYFVVKWNPHSSSSGVTTP